MDGLRVKDVELAEQLVGRNVEDLEPCVFGGKDKDPSGGIAVE